MSNFREQWKSELKGDVSGKKSKENNKEKSSLDNVQQALSNLSIELDSIEETAKKLFLQGVELEKKGKVFEAIRLYRRSIQLVPDIEIKIYEMTKQSNRQDEEKRSKVNQKAINDETSQNNNEADDEDLTDVDLVARFQHAVLKTGSICQRNTSDKVIVTGGSTHFSKLPFEIILYIFRWVLSNNQLDVRSLNMCALVCKGFYLCARDSELWKALCVKVWGLNVGTLESSPYNSWREMYYTRHRVLFSGVYLSKASYLRMGENSFQDQFYRPIHVVEYYRLIRFFPDGTLLMHTSADDPQTLVGKLKNKSNLDNDSSILQGHFRLLNNQVIIVVKSQPRSPPRYRRKKTVDDSSIKTFYIEMKIESTNKRKFCRLEWSHYSVIQMKNKTEITSEFDLTPSRYPAFWFSRVKSYHSETDSVLS